MLKVTYGTGCFLLANVGEKLRRSKSPLLETIAWQIGSKTEYAIEGSVFIGGAVIQWLRDDLRLIQSSEDSERVASEVDDTAGVMFVPAFVGLGAPYWNPRARGLIAGLTQNATRAHIVRAALESMAHQVTDVAETMALESDLVVEDVRVDGGASQNDLLMQMQSDFLDSRVLRPATIETTALGAAFLAGLSTGFWTSRDELRSIWRSDRDFVPSGNHDVDRQRRDWRKAVAKSLDWADA
jgi:glycerol kinase